MLYYVIPTTKEYAATSLPILLKSLEGTKNKILIAHCNSDKEQKHVEGNITYYYVPWNAYEYSAPLIALEHLGAGDHIFWFHDTTRCGGGFDKIVNNTNYKDYDVVEIPKNKCNIGIYSVQFLLNNKSFLERTKEFTKQEAIEWGGHLSHIAVNKTCFPDTSCVRIGIQDVYGTGNKRLVEYYDGLDLFKYKLNWRHQNSYSEVV